jgi:hypothetical protein
MPADHSERDHGAIQGTDPSLHDLTSVLRMMADELKAIRVLLERREKNQSAQNTREKFGSSISPKRIL